MARTRKEDRHFSRRRKHSKTGCEETRQTNCYVRKERIEINEKER